MSINLCSDGHDEICYEGNTSSCPVCIIIDENQSEKSDLENEVDRLNDKVDSMIKEYRQWKLNRENQNANT